MTYKGTPIRLTADFSAETLQARREWHDIFKMMKEENLQPRLLYPAREKQQITHKGIPIRLTADLSAETLQAKRD